MFRLVVIGLSLFCYDNFEEMHIFVTDRQTFLFDI